MKLERPLTFWDLESTGLDTAKDRIVSFAAMRVGDGESKTISMLFNPGVEMSEEVIAVHGIRNEDVKDKPLFEHRSETIHAFLSGSDYCGFNLIGFDVPLLWEEFYRAGIEWDITKANIIDAGNIFKKQEPRTLSAAVKFYCGRDHEEAHDALGDCKATFDVLEGQLKRYGELQTKSVAELAQFSKFDNRVDLAGKLVFDKDGNPVYNIGKSKGVKVKDDPSFGHWMLGKDFSAQTKMVLQKILEAIKKEDRPIW